MPWLLVHPVSEAADISISIEYTETALILPFMQHFLFQGYDYPLFAWTYSMLDVVQQLKSLCYYEFRAISIVAFWQSPTTVLSISPVNTKVPHLEKINTIPCTELSSTIKMIPHNKNTIMLLALSFQPTVKTNSFGQLISSITHARHDTTHYGYCTLIPDLYQSLSVHSCTSLHPSTRLYTNSPTFLTPTPTKI